MDRPHVVIGWWGGTGGALAHDLVLRGLRVTLLERGELLPLVPRLGQRLYRLPGGWADPCGSTRPRSTSPTICGPPTACTR
jgi:glycine/D-amino acid oxidase-like deaminating enzyme